MSPVFSLATSNRQRRQPESARPLGAGPSVHPLMRLLLAACVPAVALESADAATRGAAHGLWAERGGAGSDASASRHSNSYKSRPGGGDGGVGGGGAGGDRAAGSRWHCCHFDWCNKGEDSGFDQNEHGIWLTKFWHRAVPAHVTGEHHDRGGCIFRPLPICLSLAWTNHINPRCHQALC